MKTDISLGQLVENYGPLPTLSSSVEPLLHYLREQGCSKIDCIKALQYAYQLRLKEAKPLVHLSQVWDDVREQDDRFLDRLTEVVQHLVEKQTR